MNKNSLPSFIYTTVYELCWKQTHHTFLPLPRDLYHTKKFAAECRRITMESKPVLDSGLHSVDSGSFCQWDLDWKFQSFVEFWISKPRIRDSTRKNFRNFLIRISLHEAKIAPTLPPQRTEIWGHLFNSPLSGIVNYSLCMALKNSFKQ